MVEHLLWVQDVRSSNLLTPTNRREDRYLVGVHNPDLVSSTLTPATIILKNLKKDLTLLSDFDIINKRISELQDEIKLMRAEVRYLKYVWDLKEIMNGEAVQVASPTDCKSAV